MRGTVFWLENVAKKSSRLWIMRQGRGHICLTGIALFFYHHMKMIWLYDADERARKKLENKGIQATIPPKKNRLVPIFYDKNIYKSRDLIEGFFAKLKQYRAIATRYDKTATNFFGHSI